MYVFWSQRIVKKTTGQVNSILSGLVYYAEAKRSLPTRRYQASIPGKCYWTSSYNPSLYPPATSNNPHNAGSRSSHHHTRTSLKIRREWPACYLNPYGARLGLGRRSTAVCRGMPIARLGQGPLVGMSVCRAAIYAVVAYYHVAQYLSLNKTNSISCKYCSNDYGSKGGIMPWRGCQVPSAPMWPRQRNALVTFHKSHSFVPLFAATFLVSYPWRCQARAWPLCT